MLNYSVIVSKKTIGSKIKVLAPNGRWASPYRVEGRALVKRVSESAYLQGQAVCRHRRVSLEAHAKSTLIPFALSGGTGAYSRCQPGSLRAKASLHGDGVAFALTRFVPLKELKLVQERPPARGQLSLFAGVGV
jgi:hypothetical protein